MRRDQHAAGDSGDYESWLAAVKKFVRSRRPDIEFKAINEDVFMEGFREGQTPMDFAYDLVFVEGTESQNSDTPDPIQGSESMSIADAVGAALVYASGVFIGSVLAGMFGFRPTGIILGSLVCNVSPCFLVVSPRTRQIGGALLGVSLSTVILACVLAVRVSHQ